MKPVFVEEGQSVCDDFLNEHWGEDNEWEPSVETLIHLRQSGRGFVAYCETQLDRIAGSLALVEAQAIAGVGNFNYPPGKTVEVRKAQSDIALFGDYTYRKLREARRYHTERRAYLLALIERLESEMERIRARRSNGPLRYGGVPQLSDEG
jgi:hypothetical protein